MMRCKRLISVIEMLLVVSLTASFAYLVHETDTTFVQQSVVEERERGVTAARAARALAALGSVLFDARGFVSALENQDAQQGTHTCLLSKEGKTCQEYVASECAGKCTSSCIPTGRTNVAACKPGTCLDTTSGVCQTGAPQSTCTAGGGQWFDDPHGNVPQCRKGCCLIGGKATFMTEQGCTHQASFLGAPREFRADVRTEIQCLALASVQEEGACVFVKEFERSCKFTTKAQCLQFKGDFHSQLLCSNTALNTTCTPQQTTGCGTALDGTQKVYWFDSCGNRENVYDYNRRVELQRLGRAVPANESCSVARAGNPVANARLCGNCNYLLGSACGKATEQEKAAIGEYVCRDLSCVDETGKKRAHGESWCQYQSAIGVDSTKNRGMEVPGSRHFRKVCVKGEVRTDPCADYRNEICIESQVSVDGGKFSSAACRINLAYQCFDYNGIVNDEQNRGLGEDELKAKNDQRNRKCEQNPDCFVKHVQVGKEFQFDYCVPKYKPGFASAERGDLVCSQANVQCKAIYVKEIGGWKCKANCQCVKPAFAEQMNDLCMSLGDCGGQVNYNGDYSQNYRVTSSKGKIPRVSQTYITELIKYSGPVKGKYIEAPDIEQFYSFLGIPAGLGEATAPDDPASAFGSAGMISGMMGIGLLAAAKTTIGLQALTAIGLASKGGIFLAGGANAGGTFFPTLVSIKAGLSAAGSVLAGAAIGFAVTSLLLQYTGVGRGLHPALTHTLIAAGTGAGAIIGLNLALTGTSKGAAIGAGAAGFSQGGLAFAAAVAWVVIIAVIVIIAIFAALGIGKMRKVTVSFTCNPWQAPANNGDACKKCGSGGLPCTPYACQSLGQSCQLINGETEKPECISIAQNDSTAPIITFDSSTLPRGNYTIEPHELGVRVKNSASSDGCIQESFTAVPLSINLNEPAQCAASNESGVGFEEMEEDYSSVTRNRYSRNHTRHHFIPSLESLGFEDFDPRARTDQTVFVKCKDYAGNTNVRDYAISYCIEQGPDLTPAAVLSHDPALDSVMFGATNVSVNVYASEPATCKWDTLDTDYSLMTGAMQCDDDIDERTLRGWRCSASVPVGEKETTYHVRCMDQPWLNESQQDKRNVNTQSYSFKLRRSSSALQIDSLTPDGQTLSVGTEPASVTFAVKTSGGVDGTARCSFSWQNGSYIDFAQGLWTNVNQQTFQAILSGTYEMPIRCVDLAGNKAERTARFTVQIDNRPPEITRLFREGNSLVVTTNEQAECVASTNAPSRGESGCAYAWANGTGMGAPGLHHRVIWKEGTTYYIKCKDRFERGPGTECTVIARGIQGGNDAQGL